MFTLKGTVRRNAPVELEDSGSVKTALTALEYYDDSETGLSPYSDDTLFHAISDFQKDNDLKPDQVIKPEGPTHKTIKRKLSEDRKASNTFSIFVKNRADMIEADTYGADKYFHCKANYEAAELGNESETVVKALNFGREAYGFFKGDNLDDTAFDMFANEYGKNAARSRRYNSAKEACEVFRPKALDPKY